MFATDINESVSESTMCVILRVSAHPAHPEFARYQFCRRENKLDGFSKTPDERRFGPRECPAGIFSDLKDKDLIPSASRLALKERVKKKFACFFSFPVQNIQNIEEKICSRR